MIVIYPLRCPIFGNGVTAARLVLSQLVEVQILTPELMNILEDKLIIKPTDTLNIVWSGDRQERILFNSLLYKYCIEGHWVYHNDFYKNKTRGDGLESSCKKCRSKEQNHRRKRKLWKEALLEQQDYLCDICGKDLRGITNPDFVHVDHDHKTNEIRGVLCHLCNNGLGKFKDDLEILERAIEYLKKHSIGA